jgi:hypothetical protein
MSSDSDSDFDSDSDPTFHERSVMYECPTNAYCYRKLCSAEFSDTNNTFPRLYYPRENNPTLNNPLYFRKSQPWWRRMEGQPWWRHMSQPLEIETWSIETLYIKATFYLSYQSDVSLANTYICRDDHWGLSEVLQKIPHEVFVPPFAHINPLVYACIIGCMGCVKLCLKYNCNTPETLSQVHNLMPSVHFGERQKECIRYLASQTPIHPVNLAQLLPILVHFKSQQHPLFTIDAFRWVFKFAMLSPFKQERP